MWVVMVTHVHMMGGEWDCKDHHMMQRWSEHEDCLVLYSIKLHQKGLHEGLHEGLHTENRIHVDAWVAAWAPCPISLLPGIFHGLFKLISSK